MNYFLPKRALTLALVALLYPSLWVVAGSSSLAALAATTAASAAGNKKAGPKPRASVPAKGRSSKASSKSSVLAPKATSGSTKNNAGKGNDSVHKAAVSNQNADFKLNASMNTNPAKSAVDTYGSLGAGDGAPAPVTFEREFDMLVAPKVKEQNAQLDVASTKKAAVDKTAQLQAAEASSVDWSGWAGQLADRWFGNLKNLEYNSHRGWTTDQPAMIQFTCHADGRITNIQLRQSCGNTAYDNMQIEALKRTIPAPSFPSGTHLNSYTLIQGWEAHPRHPGEEDYKPGSFGKNMPAEKVPAKKPLASSKKS